MEIQMVRVGVSGVTWETATVPDDYFADGEVQQDENAQRDFMLADHEMRLLLLENGL